MMPNKQKVSELFTYLLWLPLCILYNNPIRQIFMKSMIAHNSYVNINQITVDATYCDHD